MVGSYDMNSQNLKIKVCPPRVGEGFCNAQITCSSKGRESQ